MTLRQALKKLIAAFNHAVAKSIAALCHEDATNHHVVTKALIESYSFRQKLIFNPNNGLILHAYFRPHFAINHQPKPTTREENFTPFNCSIV